MAAKWFNSLDTNPTKITYLWIGPFTRQKITYSTMFYPLDSSPCASSVFKRCYKDHNTFVFNIYNWLKKFVKNLEKNREKIWLRSYHSANDHDDIVFNIFNYPNSGTHFSCHFCCFIKVDFSQEQIQVIFR